ncbi:MAG: hypothetical protein R3D26_12445 [Cyanobacteriota/Melainabacteria group bacterium]
MIISRVLDAEKSAARDCSVDEDRELLGYLQEDLQSLLNESGCNSKAPYACSGI